MKRIISVLLFGLTLISGVATAEQKIVKGNWDIHYIAFPSSFLKPDVAKSYGLQRSKYMAVVNVSVLDNENNDKAQNVYMSGTARNLLGQTTKLEFEKVQDGPSIYYLSQFKHSDNEIFHIEINAQLGDRIETIKFKKKMVVD